MSTHKPFEELVQRYADGRSSTEELQYLNARLLQDEEARKTFLEWMNVDAGLAALASGHSALASTTVRKKRGGQWSSSRRVWPVLIALCVGVLIAGSWHWNAPSLMAFATVNSSEGVSELSRGAALGEEWHVIQAGTLELTTALQAHIVIEAPARFRFESTQRLHLTHGRLAAEVPPSAKRFTVVTPTGDVVDLGTRFGVDVPRQGNSEVHVFQGEVVAQSFDEGKTHNLYDGEALALEGSTSEVRAIRSGAFIQPSEIPALHAAIASGRQAASEQVFARLKKDPALISLLDFELGSRLNGACQLVQGRWPGSCALEFRNDDDYFSIPLGEGQAWPQLTLAAWVRLDRLNAPYQSLLHSVGSKPGQAGQIHWMVSNTKTVNLGLSGNVGPNESLPEQHALNSQALDGGHWVHLAVTYDVERKTYRHYQNGLFDHEQMLNVVHPAVLGQTFIGNWKSSNRKLSGRIDDLVILGRAMSDQEIQALYDAGNPYR